MADGDYERRDARQDELKRLQRIINAVKSSVPARAEMPTDWFTMGLAHMVSSLNSKHI